MFDITLESMQAQVRSKLGMELDKLWQKVIDYRDTNLTVVADYKTRYKCVCNFFMKNCAVAFMDLVWKYVGLWISSVETTEIWKGGFATVSYMGGNGKLPYGSVQIGNILSGGWMERILYGLIPPNTFTAEELVKIASSWDSKIGGIKEKCRQEIAKTVQAKVYFDVRTAFLIEDWLPKNSGVTNFTAQEITGIVLHELGHTLVLVEHAADQFAHATSFNYLTQAFASTADGNPSKVLALGEEVAKLVETKKNNKKMAAAVRGFCNQAKVDLVRAGSSAEAGTTRKFFGGFLSGLCDMLKDLFFVPVDLISGANAAKLSATDKKKKYGDLPVNSRLMTWEERKADEYAFSNGYGADIVVALNKMDKLFARIGKTPEEIAQINSAEDMHKKLGLMTALGILLEAPTVCGEYSYELYPHGMKRFKEMLGLVIQQLKANGADPEYVQKYIKDADIIIDRIEHYDRKDNMLASMVHGYELIMSYISIPSIFDILVKGRIARELDRLIDQVQELSNNTIYLFGAKFQNLAK